MSIGYDPLLGELRSSNAKLILPPEPYKSKEPILHLPLRDDVRDISPYKHQLPNSQMVISPYGWASGRLEFPLDKYDFSEITLAANVHVDVSSHADMFGIDSEMNAFFWQYRIGTKVVLETWNSSYDHNFSQIANGQPFHLTATLTGQIITIYLNGQLFDQTRWSDLFFPGATFYIWDGWGVLSDVRLYNACLSEAEVWDIYQTDKR